MKKLLWLTLAVCFTIAAFAGQPTISLDYKKMVINLDQEIIQLDEKQREEFQKLKKELDEKGATNDFYAICPHFDEIIIAGDDNDALKAFIRSCPQEMMVIKYNLKLRAEAQSNNK